MKTTPAQVRRLLKKHKLPYGITKTEGFWYVHNGDTIDWEHTNLMVTNFYNRPPEYWLDLIIGMHEENVKRINLDRADEETKAALVAIENYKRSL